MQTIRLKNLRSFLDTNEIEIKDLNIFVGENSSGKSTFLRVFPLLRQSILRDTRGPILWYDDTLVDFGSYEEAKSRYAPKDEGIQFGFKIKLKPKQKRSYYYFDRLQLKHSIITDINIEIYERNRKSYIGKIFLKFEGHSIEIIAGESGIIKTFKINQKEFQIPEGTHYLIKVDRTGLIPSFFILSKNEKRINNSFYLTKCRDIIKSIVGKRVKNEYRLNRIITDVTIGSKEEILTSLKNNSTIRTWHKKVSSWELDTPIFNELLNLILAHFTPTILQSIDNNIKTYFDECKYIAPIRAKAIRYYRYQDLSISEVDAYGDNLHMFLNNLNATQLESYQNFVKKVFNFKPSTHSSKGHITIDIENSYGETFNITDLGFGYSQILPIITKLWYAYSSSPPRKRFNHETKTITLLIEQPELHLHPAMQAQVADAFIYAIENAKSNNIHLKLVIETHSPVIINRIGRRIAEGKIKSSNVNVNLFQVNNDLKYSKVISSKFNNKGVLENWPIGFFEPKN